MSLRQPLCSALVAVATLGASLVRAGTPPTPFPVPTTVPPTTAPPRAASPLPAAAAPSAAGPGASAAAPDPKAKGQTEFLVGPGGGAFEVPIHAGAVCILTFPERVAPSALGSSNDFEVRSWGDDGVAVRSSGKLASTTTLAIATISGSIKVNLTFRLVPDTEPALTLIQLRAVTDEEAFQARLARELDRKLAPIRAARAAERAALEETIRQRAEATLAERLLRRTEDVSLRAHERNAAAVIVHVRRAVITGEDAYLFFDVENRSKVAYRLAQVRVVGPDGKDRAGVVRLTTGPTKDPQILGTVAAGTSARVIVAVRGAEALKGKKLTLSVAEPQGRGRIELSRQIELP